MGSEGIAGVRVLIVEDEAMIAMLLQDMLEEMGCVVAATAASLDDALRAAASDPLDLAILDVNLGGTETYPVADALRRRGVPYVFSTGYTQNAIVHNGMLDPGVDMIGKPFTQTEIARKLAQVLDRAAPAAG